jgi:adenosylhomocysteine nucleosidase
MRLSFPSTGVIAALGEEVACILANGAYGWQPQSDHYVSPHAAALVVSGVGKANAAFALAKIFDAAEQILIIGTSGGLGLQQPGSVYMVTEFVEHDMDASGLGFAPGVTPLSWMEDPVLSCVDEAFVASVSGVCESLGIPLYRGRAISGDQFLSDADAAAEKARLFGADIVDMESAAIAKICMQYKKPVLALRYITDNANHEAGASWQEHVRHSSAIMDSILSALLRLSP